MKRQMGTADDNLETERMKLATAAPRGQSHVRCEDGVPLSLACVLLSVSFVTGGSSQETGVGVLGAQLTAIAVLIYVFLQTRLRERITAAWKVMSILAILVLLPLLQLLPIPESLWMLPSARVALQHDLAIAGAASLDHRWTLSPAATERDSLAMLPPAALFLVMLALGYRARYWMLWWIIALSLFSMLLGIAQVGAGQDSVLNLYPQWPPAMGGVFANPNHQATVIAIALVLSIALMLDAWNCRDRPALLVGGCVALAAIFAAAIPVIGSRAGPIVAIVPTVALVFAAGRVPAHGLRARRRNQLIVLFSIAALSVGIYSALHWTRGENVDAIRSLLTRQTASIAQVNAPLGGGIGTFVPVFEQGAAVSIQGDEYINNAHNDYAQLWLEGGVAAMFGMIGAFAVLAVTFYRLLRLRPGSHLRTTGLGAAMSLLVVILHSWVDYPLRTPALIAVFASLAGIAIGASHVDTSKI